MTTVTVNHVADWVRAALPDASLSELAAATDGLDLADAETAARAVYTWREWNRADAINGIPAATWLAREDVPAEGAIVLVEHAGELLLFQPHVPTGGPINDATAVGDALVDQLVAQAVLTAIGPGVVESILDTRAAAKAAEQTRADDLQAQIDALADFIATTL